MKFFAIAPRSTFCLATLLSIATPSLLQAAEASRDEAKAESSEEAKAPTKKLWESDPWTKPELMVGDDAPAIDIEHWIQDGKGAFKHITEFEPGKVYVVEFWATWCGPCVASIPHLSELQEKFAKQGVQIISVSDESKDDIKKFLKLALPENDKQTFADVTAVYCLTTDPDRSVYEAYMDAALRNGIPNAFIVGKEGKIEWIGHPTEMDDALSAVVDGSWDRKEFKAKFDAEQRLDGVRNQVLMKAESDIEEAEAMIDDLIASAPDENAKAAAEGLRAAIGIPAFHEYVESDQQKAAKLLPQLVKQGKGQPFYLANLVVALERRIAAGDEVIPELYEPALEAIDETLPNSEGFEKEVYRCLRVRLLQAKGEIDQAIKEEEALLNEATTDENKKEYQGVLDQLKEAKAKQES